jgi:hypothetical protein
MLWNVSKNVKKWHIMLTKMLWNVGNRVSLMLRNVNLKCYEMYVKC